jgi:hypothetical protein
MAECGYNMNWGGLCKEPRVYGREVCARHLQNKCVVCGRQAVLECYSHLGNWECGMPLCKEHEFRHHHDDDAETNEYLARLREKYKERGPDGYGCLPWLAVKQAFIDGREAGKRAAEGKSGEQK